MNKRNDTLVEVLTALNKRKAYFQECAEDKKQPSFARTDAAAMAKGIDDAIAEVMILLNKE